MINTYSLAPIPQLRGFIKNIWIVENGSSNIVEKMIPFGCMDLVYVENEQVSYQSKKEIQFIKNDIFITGQVTQPYDLDYSANAQIIGFGFYPHTAHFFIQDSVFQFTNNVCRIGALFSYPDILERLREQTGIKNKVYFLEQLILSRIRKVKHKDKKHKYLTFLLKNMYKNKGQFDLSKLQNDLKISERYIQSLFKEYVGISPLLYSKVIRFLNAVDIYQKSKIPLTELAYNLGYYDQSHFIRDFKRFTGLSPKKYFNTLPYLIEQFTTNEQCSLLYNSIIEK